MSKKKLKKAKKKIKLQEEKYAALQIMLEMTTDNMRRIQSELKISKEELEGRNSYINDSINYAFRLQKALLDSERKVVSIFPNSYIYFRPKDIVSGDFYWTYSCDQYDYFAVLDCTGHGIPGAMLTFLGVSILNNTVQNKSCMSLEDLASRLHHQLVMHLQSNQDENRMADGMDILMIRINKEKTELEYLGTKRPLFWYRDGVVSKLRGNRFSIGDENFDENELKIQKISICKGDMFYLTSDGFADQMNEAYEKYKVGNFKKLLEKMYPEPLDIQKKMLNNELETWKGKQVQTDDILIAAIRI